jgi:spoIIIJ-associated protein
MSVKKKDFYAKEVTDAIKDACQELQAPQENLDIEVVETGSTGIFGLIRKKAHIRARLKPAAEQQGDVSDIAKILESPVQKRSGKVEPVEATEELDEAIEPGPPEARDQDVEERPTNDSSAIEENEPSTSDRPRQSLEPVREQPPDQEQTSAESIELVRAELLSIVEHMGFPSSVDIEVVGLSISCTLRGEHEADLSGSDGKVLDSLQYLLRKIISRKVKERLRISLNVGEFRQRRLEELKVRAIELAAQVKEDGKTQVLPALNPGERREIHMVLQEDKEIRSRSVGDGLFKKILIYQPGKGVRGGRKRSGSRGRNSRSTQKDRKKTQS